MKCSSLLCGSVAGYTYVRRFVSPHCELQTSEEEAWCNVLQCVAEYCNISQSAAECCRVLQSVAVLCRVLVTVCCRVLRYIAKCCRVLQSVVWPGHASRATNLTIGTMRWRCSVLQCVSSPKKRLLEIVLQCVVAWCSVLQCAAVCCSVFRVFRRHTRGLEMARGHFKQPLS